MAEPTWEYLRGAVERLLSRIEILERRVAQLERRTAPFLVGCSVLFPVEVSEEEFDRLTKDHPDMIGVPVIQCGDRVWPKRKPSPSQTHASEAGRDPAQAVGLYRPGKAG